MLPLMNILLFDGLILHEPLRAAGHNILVHSPPETGIIRLPEVLAEHNFTPDLIVQSEHLARRVLIQGLPEAPCPKVFWAIDSHLNLYWHRYYARLFDAVLTPHPSLWAELPPEWRHPRVVPFSKPGYARPFKPHTERTNLISLVGVLNKHRHLRLRLAELLKNYWGVEARQNIPFAEMLNLYDDTKIIPNESIAREVNYRLMETASCGAVPLTQDVGPDQDSLFEPGREMLVYRDAAELVAQINALIANPAKAEAIGRAAWERVQRDHLPANRVATLEALARELNPKLAENATQSVTQAALAPLNSHEALSALPNAPLALPPAAPLAPPAPAEAIASPAVPATLPLKARGVSTNHSAANSVNHAALQKSALPNGSPAAPSAPAAPPLDHDQEDALLWLCLVQMHRSWHPELRPDQLIAQSIHLPQDPESLSYRLRLLAEYNGPQNVMPQLEQILSQNMHRASLDLNLAGSLIALRAGHQNLARQFLYRQQLYGQNNQKRASPNVARPESPHALCLAWADFLSKAGRKAQLGLTVNTAFGIPECAWTVLLLARHLLNPKPGAAPTPDELSILKKIEALTGNIKGLEFYHLGYIAQLCLAEPDNWMLQMRYADACLQTFHLEEGLAEREAAQGRDRRRREGGASLERGTPRGITR